MPYMIPSKKFVYLPFFCPSHISLGEHLPCNGFVVLVLLLDDSESEQDYL